ncbi:hypothetical protein CQS04_05205 [Chryseomicrobium excrementi]|uniref:Uncharacterized protein n=1 Tax=Chryseomicrobium excrementi TaxID=2041346 RepID=A0A2M9EZD2_9BACL|nr:hypothetical protein [Chryseomicrobium excrementi]PJK16559.1 hypothetical protein CQS04_05205 [Chryseomicrobium excrementi]
MTNKCSLVENNEKSGNYLLDSLYTIYSNFEIATLNAKLKNKKGERRGSMKNNRGLLILVISLLMLYGCNNNEKQSVTSTTGPEEVSSENETEKELLALSEQIFLHLKESNYEKIAERVDPVDGITFSLFADFGAEHGYGGEYVKLSTEEIKSAADKQFVWGYDDSDKEYKMSLRDYVNEMLLKLNGEEITYDKTTFNQSAFEYGGVKNTIHENYPDAKYVEYYAPDKSGENRAFQSIRFIFQERDGIWYLIGISRDVATG